MIANQSIEGPLDGPLIISSPGAKVNNGLFLATEGGVLRIEDEITGTGTLEAHNGTIEVNVSDIEAGEVTIGSGGTYQANPNTNREVSASLTAQNIEIRPVYTRIT